MSYIKSKIEEWFNKIPISWYFIKIQKEIEIKTLLTELENAEYEEVELGSICEYIKKGKRNNTHGTLYPYYKSIMDNKIIQYSDTYLFDGPHILMCGTGSEMNIGKSIIVDDKFYVNDNLYVIKNKENINITYIYNKLQSLSTEINACVVGNAISMIHKERLSKLKIKIPTNRLLMQNYDKINILQKEIKLFEIEYNKLYHKLYLELENFSMVLF